jgi:hypothetical protein
MTDTPLIRRQTTVDRTIYVSTRDVLRQIQILAIDEFTTREIAESMQSAHRGIDPARLEYAVRTAVKWLVTRGDVRPVGARKHYTVTHGAQYWATTYGHVERGADWLQIQKGDPLTYVLEKEARSCKGCYYKSSLWGVWICTKKNKVAESKCSKYREEVE